jgi:predicted RNA polymerase sigma factor
MLHAEFPDDGKINGELAVMRFIHAHCDARTVPSKRPIPRADQNRTRWDRDLITVVQATLTERGPTLMVMSRCPPSAIA